MTMIAPFIAAKKEARRVEALKQIRKDKWTKFAENVGMLVFYIACCCAMAVSFFRYFEFWFTGV